MSKKSSELVGKTVKGYKIIKSIGEGKFSQVYRAETENKIPYAMKNIKIFDMADQKSRDKCLKQVELMKPLDHPNIIKYIDSFIQNNQLYIVTEWAQKGDLKKLIKQHSADDNPFDQATIWEYMRQISSALKHMHEKKIMHRDLKPANIFISQDMSLKVGDLGLGRVFGSETLEAYSKVGTPLYMSPELIQDSGYNFNADVWSLGCICYQLCQLNSPFRNKQQKMSLMDLFQNITKCNYKPISNKYSPQLSQVIKKMIVVDPNYRFSSQQVLQIAQKNLKGIKKPLLDPLIVMDDIYIKLNLLDYLNNFCKSAERKQLNKFYFAFEDEKAKGDQQLFYFMELCYWVMALSKSTQKKKEKIPIYSKTNIDWSSPQNACRKLLVDLGGFGVRLDQVELQSVVNGYGESICYILNQVLNRELIRINFQFKQPKQTAPNQPQNTDPSPQQPLVQPQDDISNASQKSDSIQQQEFEQSIFYKKGKNYKIGTNQDMRLLEKIQEFGAEEEDRGIIQGRVDEKQWKSQCLRVQKKMNDIVNQAKQARKKSGYQNFQTIKINSSKITDLIRSLKPITTQFSTKLQQQLSTIKRGEQRIRSSFKNLGQQYSQKSQQHKQLTVQSQNLANSLKQKLEIYEKIQEKLEQVNMKIGVSSSQTESSKVSEIKKSIKQLQKQIKEMERKQGILQWQLRVSMIAAQKYSKKDRKADLEELEFEED